MYSSGHEAAISIQILTSLTVSATPPLTGMDLAPGDGGARSGRVLLARVELDTRGEGCVGIRDDGARPRVGCITRNETALDRRAALEESGRRT